MQFKLILTQECVTMASSGGTGSGHFSLLIAYLRLFGTHMSLVAILLLSEIPIDRYIKIPDYISNTFGLI